MSRFRTAHSQRANIRELTPAPMLGIPIRGSENPKTPCSTFNPVPCTPETRTTLALCVATVSSLLQTRAMTTSLGRTSYRLMLKQLPETPLRRRRALRLLLPALRCRFRIRHVACLGRMETRQRARGTFHAGVCGARAGEGRDDQIGRLH